MQLSSRNLAKHIRFLSPDDDSISVGMVADVFIADLNAAARFFRIVLRFVGGGIIRRILAAGHFVFGLIFLTNLGFFPFGLFLGFCD